MGTVVFITADRIGDGDPELGARLMASYLYSLARGEDKPERIVLMNEGVRLACEGSTSLDDLQLLAEDGVLIYACGTCLNWYRVHDTLRVGEVGNMTDTAAMLMAADKVVTVR